MRKIEMAALCAALALGLAGCSKNEATPAAPPAAAPKPDLAVQKELGDLRQEVNRLRAENAELKLTPAVLLGEVDAATRAGDPSKVGPALKKLVERYPSSPEAKTATSKVDAFVAAKKAEKAEADRIASLGLAAVKVNPKANLGSTTMSVTNASISEKWVFDNYGHGSMYVEAERGNRWVVATVQVSSESKDPDLNGVALYEQKGANLEQMGQFGYRFVRWQDYGNYLGNEHDFRNDFAHSPTIPFTLGFEGSAQRLKGPLYIVATKETCHQRDYERFKHPPVSYPMKSGCTSLKSTLTADDFKSGNLVLLRKIG